jgi:hypothetical protein
MTPSAFIRLALQQALGQSSAGGTPAGLHPQDTLDRFVRSLRPHVQQVIRQAITAVGFTLERVLRTLIIMACQPKALPPPPHEGVDLDGRPPLTRMMPSNHSLTRAGCQFTQRLPSRRVANGVVPLMLGQPSRSCPLTPPPRRVLRRACWRAARPTCR